MTPRSTQNNPILELLHKDSPVNRREPCRWLTQPKEAQPGRTQRVLWGFFLPGPCFMGTIPFFWPFGCGSRQEQLLTHPKTHHLSCRKSRICSIPQEQINNSLREVGENLKYLCATSLPGLRCQHFSFFFLPPLPTVLVYFQIFDI